MRTYEGFEKFADLEAVDDDAINVRNGVFGLGARQMDIITFEDANFVTQKQMIRDLRKEIEKNWV